MLEYSLIISQAITLTRLRRWLSNSADQYVDIFGLGVEQFGGSLLLGFNHAFSKSAGHIQNLNRQTYHEAHRTSVVFPLSVCYFILENNNNVIFISMPQRRSANLNNSCSKKCSLQFLCFISEHHGCCVIHHQPWSGLDEVQYLFCLYLALLSIQRIAKSNTCRKNQIWSSSGALIIK